MKTADEYLALASTAGANNRLAEAHAIRELVAEVQRLNQWADSFTDTHLRERQTGDALIKELTGERDRLVEEVNIGNKLLKHRDQLLAAIPQCEDHGPCVPHALEWVAESIRIRTELAYAPLSKEEAHDLTAMVYGAPWSDNYCAALVEVLAQYEKLRASGRRPVDPADAGTERERKPAPSTGERAEIATKLLDLMLHPTDREVVERAAALLQSTAHHIGDANKMVAALPVPFQERVNPWLLACFGQKIADDTQERNHRFLEESLELVQACGCTPSEAHQLVDYVYGRPVGEKTQEVGGVMVTLAALCLAQRIDMHQCGDVELARIWTKVEKIRAKQAAKPKHSPLPEHVAALPVGELTTCNCRWNGDVQVQSCTLHAAHVDAIHEWAERARTTGWISVTERLPETGVLVLVRAPATEDDWTKDDRISLDYISEDWEDWGFHCESHEHFMAVGGANAAGPDVVCTGPSQKAPYTHWFRWPDISAATSAGEPG